MRLHAVRLIFRYKPGGSYMDKTIMSYFKDDDILHIVISEGKEADSVELSPNIIAELNESGELIGIEIIKASSFLLDSILESSQAKIHELKKAI